MLDHHTSEKKARAIAHHLYESQGQDVLILDMRNHDHIVDFFIIATIRSETHKRGLMKRVETLMRQNYQQASSQGHRRNSATEGWVVLDYYDVCVHIMNQELRDFFALERLWFDAPQITVEPTAQQHIDSSSSNL